MSDMSEPSDVVFIESRAPRLMVMGRQGAGKGTQAGRIASRFGVTWLSTGELLRAAIESATPMGVLAAPFVARPDPAPAVQTPAPPATPPPPAFVLQAISERNGQPIAIINDHLVRVGDEVDGMRVLAIRLDEVDVEVRGRRTTLRF